MPTKTIMLVGASGHARVVLDALFSQGESPAVVVFDDNTALKHMECMGYKIHTPVVWRAHEFAYLHVAIGQNEIRRRMYFEGHNAELQFLTIQHKHSLVSCHARVGGGVFVAAGAIVAPGAWVGDGVIVNHGAVIDHDCRVGDFSHVAPLAALGGGVRIGTCVLIGAGSVVLPGREVGDGAIIGAGAVVTHDVPARTSVMGVPARKGFTK